MFRLSYVCSPGPGIRHTRLVTSTLHVPSAFLMASELSSPAIPNFRGEEELLDTDPFPESPKFPHHLKKVFAFQLWCTEARQPRYRTRQTGWRLLPHAPHVELLSLPLLDSSQKWNGRLARFQEGSLGRVQSGFAALEGRSENIPSPSAERFQARRQSRR